MDAMDPLRALILNECAHDVQWCVERLHPTERAVLTLTCKGLTQVEIGNRLSLAQSTVSYHLSWARQHLKAMLEEMGQRLPEQGDGWNPEDWKPVVWDYEGLKALSVRTDAEGNIWHVLR